MTPTKCDVCGRGLPPRTSKRGRAKTRHNECSEALYFLAAAQKALDAIRYHPDEVDERRNLLRKQLQNDFMNGALHPGRTRKRTSTSAKEFKPKKR